MNRPGFTRLFLVLPALALLQGCGTAFESVLTQGTILYTQGARQDTAMLEIHLPPQRVYQGLLDAIAERPHLRLISQNPRRYLIEVERDDGASLSGQATELSEGRTLFFIWADAGDKGAMTGTELARSTAEAICRQLAVTCTIKDS